METVSPRIFSPEDRPVPRIPKWTIGVLCALVIADVADSLVPSLLIVEVAISLAAVFAALRLGMAIEEWTAHRLRSLRPPIRAAIVSALVVAPFVVLSVASLAAEPLALHGTLEAATLVTLAFVLAAIGGLFVLLVEGISANVTRTFRRRIALVSLLSALTAGGLGVALGPFFRTVLRSGSSDVSMVHRDPTMTYVEFPGLGEHATFRNAFGNDVPRIGGLAFWLSDRALPVAAVVFLGALIGIPTLTATGRIASDSVERLEPLVAAFGELAKGDRNVRVERGGAREFERLADRFNEMVANLAEAERMERAFGIYVSGQVLDRIKAQHGEATIPAALREASVLFADIRGFTAMSEKLSPEQVVSILNRWFDRVVNIVAAHDGYLNKFIGDAVVVVFNGPMDQQDHASRAARCAIELQKAAIEMNAAGAFKEIGELRVGVGVATGPMVCGNVGGTRQMEYTVIGDTVNLASRLTSKAAPGEVLVSETTGVALGGAVVAEKLDPVPVKGKAEPVTPYRVFPIGASAATKQA